MRRGHRSPVERLYGRHPVREALRAGRRRVRTVWILAEGGGREARAEIESLARASGAKVETAARDRLSRLAGTADHQGVVAEADPYPYENEGKLLERVRSAGGPVLLLALDGVQDPRNLGSMIRCANTAGALAVIIPRDRAAGVTAVTAKASAGAVEHTPVARVTNLVHALEALREAGVWIAGVSVDGEKSLDNLDATGPLALVIGGEGRGLRPLVRRTCDFCVSIPLAGEIESLNASAAAAILLHEAGRQRRAAGV